MARDYGEHAGPIPTFEYRDGKEYRITVEGGSESKTYHIHNYYKAVKGMEDNLHTLKGHHQIAKTLYSRLQGQSDEHLVKEAADHESSLEWLVNKSQDHPHQFEKEMAEDKSRYKGVEGYKTLLRYRESVNNDLSRLKKVKEDRNRLVEQAKTPGDARKGKEKAGKDMGRHSPEPWPFFAKGEGSG